MSDIKLEEWTLSEIAEAISKTEYKGKRIVIPLFQRGKRWNQEKELKFISSLRKSFPVGTILFYRTLINNIETYTLIDGLQRSNTIKKFFESPNNYFKINEIEKSLTDDILKLTSINGSVTKINEQINSIILGYIQSIKNIDNIELFDLLERFIEVFPILNEKRKQLSETLKPFIVNYKLQFQKLSKTKIPAIVYTGDESNLPEIFELINSQGVPLSNYEIYAASWPKQRFEIQNNQIIENILKKYDSLNDIEFELAGYNRDEIRINKKISAFDYVFGLGKYFDEKYSIFTYGTKENVDEVSKTGFILLNACFNDDYGSIKDVHKIIYKFKDKIHELESKLENSIDFVVKHLNHITQFKGNSRKNKSTNFHTFFMIISIVSFVFRTHFDIDNLKSKDDSWSKNKQTLKDNIWRFYVYDIISNTWQEGGTTKVHAYNKDLRYLRLPEKNQFQNAIEGYFQDTLTRREMEKVSGPKPQDYLILNTIYQTLFSARDQLDSTYNYDLEHLATKKLLKSIMTRINTSKDEGLPISSISNLCYLSQYINRSKQELTIYQDENFLKKSNLTLQEIEEKHTFTRKSDLDFLNKNYQDGDFYELKQDYFNFLKNRFTILKDKFLLSLFNDYK